LTNDGLSVLDGIALAGRQLDNRLAFNATVNNLGRNLEVTDEQIAFYAARAAGGTGLLITEGMSVHPASMPNQTVPLAYEPEMIPGLARMAAAVHEHDRAIYAQLWHVGRQALWTTTLQPWSTSAERDPYSGTTPHVMSDAEVLEVIDGFRRSAANVREAGFDGVELHGAHGYLITQFLSPLSNPRDDRWGGSVAGRSRFVVEIARAIRAECGPDFGIGLKLTAHEYVDGGLDLALSRQTIDHILDEVELDYVGVSQANFSPSLEYHVPDLRFPDVPFEDLAAGIHDAVAGRAATMALCKVPDLETASRLIDEGKAELVGMVRALLADPAIVNKVRAGRRPRPCIYCNVCWEYIHTGRPVHCIYAPDTARELEQAGEAEPTPADAEPLRISVLGAGPAGLEYARVAAARGHRVEVVERSTKIGGRFESAAEVAGLERYGAAVEWLADEAKDAGAEIRLEAEDADPDADLTVVATGRRPLVAPLEGAHTVSLEEALADPAALREPIFVVDEVEAEPVYAAVEELRAAGREVAILTRRPTVGRLVSYVSLIGVLRRLDAAGIAIHTLLTPLRVEGGRLIARHSFSGCEHDLGPVGTVVRAGPYSSNEAPGDGERVVVGDASAPREALAVVYEANRRALELPDLRAGEEKAPAAVAGVGR
jgi:2,4-dienoyl-CoA reductase-like NADH-dependent reductase (Old Yellow Enzyme family)